ncbi:MAG: hypothetical protein PHE73_09220 [Sulfurovaceae bacterium]|nr:hypothetical protein [Sulfurovaceae bacterium]
MSKLDFHNSWEKIFERYNLYSIIKTDGYVDITADQIKAVERKEPRNLTKIDFREKLPKIMKEEGLSILAIKNGLYRIAKNDPFIDVKQEIETKIIELPTPQNIISIDPFNIKSESAALDMATVSNMLEMAFGEKSKLTIRGRLRGALDFNIGNIHYNVDGVQIEVDGGYESDSSIHLIEAKIGYNNNINIRQLLYPQLFWEKQIGIKKEIKSYVFYLQGDIFRFIPYYYDGAIGYLDHAKEKAFVFENPNAEIFSLNEIQIDQSKVDTNIPFPQADKFDTINTMMITISENLCISKEELKTKFAIVDRQIDYYFNVLKWLKLCIEKDGCLILTPEGERLVDLSFRKRMQEIAKIVFAEPIMNAVLNNKNPNEQIFLDYNIKSQSTIHRRLQTANAWVKYFRDLFSK